jgi:P63C domain
VSAEPGAGHHAGVLRIGDAEIPCYVLEDGTRVLSERGLLSSFGMKAGARDTEEKLPRYLRGKNIVSFIDQELKDKLSKPLWFQYKNEPTRKGFPAALLPEICNVWLKARDSNALIRKQILAAQMADILMRGLAHVGIIALIDEVTGYQEYRAKDALTRILEEFIAKELQPYVPTFQDDYYREIFRLRGLEFPRDTVKRPQYFGSLTNDIVYKRLAPGVLEELKRVTPRLMSGRHKHQLFRRLTQNKGYPKLREHLGAVVTMMQLSTTWHDFISKLDRLRPRLDVKSLTKGRQLSFDYDSGKDPGVGL